MFTTLLSGKIFAQTFVDEINNYIIWYNTKRMKQSLECMSRVEYRHRLGFAV
ncbi:MAG: IS3 family transposase [Acutalibacteraceae bacterium]